MWSLGGPQRTSYSPMCFLALGALVELLLSTCYSCVHVPSIPEFLNSGMLVGVDTARYLWGGVVLIPVLRVGSSPTSIPEFRSSGFRMCLLSLGALVELLLSHIMLCMYVPPVPWCPLRTASYHMYDMLCFLALGAIVSVLLTTCLFLALPNS